MGNYKDWRDYYKQIATEHVGILHVDDTASKKRFFEVMLDEVISGITHKLPGKDDSCFLIFSGYMDRLQFKDSPKKNRQIIFFVMKSCGDTDYSLQTEARAKCEDVIDDILARMAKDSRDELPLLEQAFNRIDNVTYVPNEIKSGSTVYVGWQVSVNLIFPVKPCYVSEKWQS